LVRRAGGLALQRAALRRDLPSDKRAYRLLVLRELPFLIYDFVIYYLPFEFGVPKVSSSEFLLEAETEHRDFFHFQILKSPNPQIFFSSAF
jgi:hypothetical protein